MRVLLASDHYPPFIGGAQRQTRLLARSLRARGHEVAVATVWQDGMADCEDDDGIQVFRLRQVRTAARVVRGTPRRRYQPPFPDPVTIVQLRSVLRRLGPDILHAAGWFGFSCAGALLGSSVPMLFSARDYGFSCPNTTLVRRERVCSGPELTKCLICAGHYYGAPRGWIAALGVRTSERLLRRKLTGLHSVSSFVQGVAGEHLVAPLAGRRHVISEVIPSFRVEQQVVEDPAVLAALPEVPYVLFVGALRRVKGIEVLLEAYSRLIEPPPLVLIGTRERDTPEAMPKGVVVLDEMPNWAVLRAWERSLFGVMPSLWPEPFGSVVHEAMSRGRPVIGTSPGGHSDMIVDRQTGLLVPAGDVGALTGALRELLEDAEQRQAMGRRARTRAAAFSEETVVPAFESLYQRVIDGAAASL